MSAAHVRTIALCRENLGIKKKSPSISTIADISNIGAVAHCRRGITMNIFSRAFFVLSFLDREGLYPS